MQVISVNGVDGTGKSTVISILQNELRARGFEVYYYHLRPRYILGNKQSNQDSRASVPPISTKKYGLVLSSAKIMMFYLDYALFCFINVFRNKTDVIFLFDRWIIDLFIFPERFGILTYRLPKIIINLFKPDLYVLLHGEASLIFSRKDELTLDQISKYQQAYFTCYKELEQHYPSCIRVNISKSPSQVAAQILSALKSQCQKYL